MPAKVPRRRPSSLASPPRRRGERKTSPPTTSPAPRGPSPASAWTTTPSSGTSATPSPRRRRRQKKQSLLASSSLERVDELDDARQADLYFVLLYVFAKWPELDCALSARYDAIKAAYSHQSAGSYEVRLEVAKLLEGSWDHTVAFATDEGIELDLAQPDAKVAVDVAFDYLRDVHTGDYVPSGATRFKASL
mmetsp:Transcript_30865/g.99581  ORF Transcript_30865/g.99581 Transcript_30865/m.99581 type:complete len:192 (-) Transcript_30865:456-1031(-)